MDLVVGAIYDGKVTGLMKFGAFVALPGGKSGLVHISEIAYSYVTEVKDFLTEGQEVKVKLIGIDDNGRINLSIKKAQEPPPKPPQRSSIPRGQTRSAAVESSVSFEDKLKQFMQDSDSKISGIRQYTDKKGSTRRNRQK
ncbi:MAG: S1 RNA-binding domain-containing protein [Clostridiales bacterium]|nr:S1 RNA-binding domain-containing protein [Clostridiales bacterium]